MTNQLKKTQVESTLYMPSMYDSEDDDECYSMTDARDESTSSREERIDTRRRNSRFSLMRCLAWSQSQAEDDNQDTKLPERKEEDDDEVRFLIQNASGGGCASFNSIHSALVDSTHYAPDNNTKNVHWEELVGSDKKLDSLLSGKNANSALS
mmetsp:Transcript_3458/g.8230  ORF Transcript_3458/g.8230 Transcript_3458/m.8230 type:complete len:152 (+) Transcript_3458:73-528(+)|eukprot:CAMPEP_0116096136 /NCGR_PEP_ID=MMETSP0327-20121206/10028_1 /TAXON_ID=44447 /ORGANISM="Pseudo-nitzschia delicatissima, Strain B596" /LENGTH=151 /DNA_ID=CAMNT_0003587835 /DNA_START=23 /DNA_END=478 /DNA_ORIENTATION=+